MTTPSDQPDESTYAEKTARSSDAASSSLPTIDFRVNSRKVFAQTDAEAAIATNDETIEANTETVHSQQQGLRTKRLVRGNLTDEHAGRYHLSDLLGEGGIGVVRSALDEHLGRDVAIKELRADRSRSERREARFVEEARITGQLEHPGIIPVYELGRRANGTLYYVMRRVRGDTLADALKDASLPDRLRLLPRLIDICQAMAYAHSQGVIHRDLKPANVMLGEFGETLVLDWGLAKVRHQDAAQSADSGDSSLLRESEAMAMATLDGQVMGTPAYMPPEQARGDIKAIDARSDVYSLGAILYEFLTGRPPYIGSSAWDVTLQVVEREIVPPRKREAEAPAELAAIAMRALARAPDDRYQDARQMVADLEAFEAGGLVAAHRYDLVELTRRWLRRHAVSIGMFFLIAVAISGAWLARGEEEQRVRARADAMRRAVVLSEVERVLERSVSPRAAGWYDAWAYKLISLKEPAVEKRLIAALSASSSSVVRLAVRALGGMGSHNAVEPLLRLLAQNRNQEQELVIEVIKALAVIGDPAATKAIDRSRRRYGQYSYVWQNTQVAARMMPPPEIPLAKRGDANAWVDRGSILLNKKLLDAAFEHYNRAIGLDPKLTRAYTNRGIVRRLWGDFRGAHKDHSAALAIDPHFPWALINRAISLRSMEAYEEALVDLNHIIGLPNPPMLANAYRNRSRVRVRLGDIDGAQSDLDMSVELQPANPTATIDLAKLAMMRGNLARAMGHMNRAVQMAPMNSIGRVERARQLRCRGDVNAALADLDHAIASTPDAAGLLPSRGSLQLLQGRSSAARVDFDRSVDIHPEMARPRWERAIGFHARQGDYAAALKDLDAAIQVVSAGRRVWLTIMRYLVALRVPGAKPDTTTLRGNGQLPRVDQLIDVVMGKRDPHPLIKRVKQPEDWCQLVLAAEQWSNVTGRPLRLALPQGLYARTAPLPTAPACGLLRAFHREPWPGSSFECVPALPKQASETAVNGTRTFPKARAKE